MKIAFLLWFNKTRENCE